MNFVAHNFLNQKSYLFALIEGAIPIKALFVNPQQKFTLGLECELMFHKEAQNHHLSGACSDDLAVSVGTLVPVQKMLLISLNIGQRGHIFPIKILHVNILSLNGSTM